MGAKITRTDFEWSYTEEPHATRRKEMLAKYPEMKKLMGVDPKFKYLVTLVVLVQLAFCLAIADQSWTTVVVMAYIFGGTLNHSLTLAIHETAHNLAFGHSRPFLNRLFGFFANLPIAIPMSISFKKYHLDHHRYQGDEKMDVDIPSSFETSFFTRTLYKFIWVLLQPWFYSIRPFFISPKPLSSYEIANIAIQFTFNILLYQFVGIKALMYLLMGSVMATGLHPIAGHFISEHYMFVKGYETFSYYGPLNLFTWNVGYHTEHHDFPSISGSRLPQVRKIAPEYYKDLPAHYSWVQVIWDFIFDPEIGPYSRVKRRDTKAQSVAQNDTSKLPLLNGVEHHHTSETNGKSESLMNGVKMNGVKMNGVKMNGVHKKSE